MKQAKTWINAQRWFIGTEDTFISRFSTLLVLVTVFACSGSIFLFHCCCHSGEVAEGYLWLQMTVSRRRTNQVCNYWFPKIFHILCHGFCCIFSVHLILIAEKDFRYVNPNFLAPSYSFWQCRVIQEHLIWSINSRHIVVVDKNNFWFPFEFSKPVDWIHHCWHMSIADDANISFVFSLSDRNVTKGHENHFTWTFFPITCDGFCFQSARKVPVIYVFLFDIYSVSDTELYQLSVNKR